MMKTSVVIALLAVLGLPALLNAQKADLVIINGRVTTLSDVSPEVEALAIIGNRIVFTGSTREVNKWVTRKTKVVDAMGRRVIPGLFDTHLHVIRGGRFYNSELRWDGIRSLKHALQLLKEQAARTPSGQWVRVVGGWNEYQFEEKRLPTLEEINEATGAVPAFVLYLYGKAWLNKAGLKQLGIDANSVNPPGGLIEKDSKGDPTGLLVAEPNAFILYSTLAKLPELTVAEKVNSTIQYMRELNSLGVTAVMDAGGGFQNFPDDYTITDSLARLGKLTLRLPYFLFAQKKGTEFDDFSRWTQMVDIHAHEGHDTAAIDYYVKGAGENLVADAADFENFLYPRPDLPSSMEANLKKVIQLLVEKRWPFRLHATYDESISRFLDVLEEVNRTTPFNNLNWLFDHAETVSGKNLLRIKALGGGIAIQHRMAFQGESFVRRYGAKAASDAPPVKKMLELGIPVALGTDGTRVASYNPWIALYWITSGKTVGGNQVLGEESRLDRLTALRLMTVGGYQLIGIKDKGTLAKGSVADIVILDNDYLSAKEDEIPSIRSKLTILDGKIVFGDKDYGQIAPARPPVIPSWSPVAFYGIDGR